MINTLKNFCAATLNASMTNLVTSIAYTANPGSGSFPIPGSGSPADTSFYLTIFDKTTYGTPDMDPNREVVLVTANSAGSFTITRAQLATAAASHPAGSALVAALTDQDIKLMISGTGDYADDTGSAGAYVSNPTMYPAVLLKGMQAQIKVLNANIGASTYNCAGTGVINITRTNGSALQPNDMVAGMIAQMTFDGTNWQLTNPNIGNASVATVPNIVLLGKSLGAGTSVTSITVAAGVATVNHTAHGYATGDFVVIAGATGSTGDINQLHQITVTNANAYTFPTTGSGAIAGTIVEMFWFKGTRTTLPATGTTWLIKNITRSGAGTYTFTFANVQADIYYGAQFGYISNTSNSLVGVAQGTAPTTSAIVLQTITVSTSTATDPTTSMMFIFTGII